MVALEKADWDRQLTGDAPAAFYRLSHADRHALGRSGPKALVVIFPQYPAISLTKPRGIVEHRVKRRGGVAGRAVDDLQYLRYCPLLLQRLGQLSLEFLNHSVKVVLFTGGRSLGRHNDAQSAEALRRL